MSGGGAGACLAVAAMLIASCEGSHSSQASLEENGMRDAHPFHFGPDSLKPDDVPAGYGDFEVLPNTRFCGLGILEPRIGKAMALDPRDPDRFNRSPFTRTGIDNDRIVAMGLSVSTSDGRTSSRSLLYNYYDTEDLERFKLQCDNNGENILITHYIARNNLGTPYTVTMTIRQGNRLWIKSISRGADDGQPIVISPYGGNILHLRIDKDSLALNKLMQDTIFGPESRVPGVPGTQYRVPGVSGTQY